MYNITSIAYIHTLHYLFSYVRLGYSAILGTLVVIIIFMPIILKLLLI